MNRSTLKDRREALRDHIEVALRVHDPAFVVESRWRQAVLLPRSFPDERRRVMGDPVRYAVISEDETGFDDGTVSAGSRATGRLDIFGVAVWIQYDDQDDYDQSSQRLYDDVINGTRSLHNYLNDVQVLTTLPDEPLLSLPGRLTPSLVLLGDNPVPVFAHYATFNIGVYDA